MNQPTRFPEDPHQVAASERDAAAGDAPEILNCHHNLLPGNAKPGICHCYLHCVRDSSDEAAPSSQINLDR